MDYTSWPSSSSQTLSHSFLILFSWIPRIRKVFLLIFNILWKVLVEQRMSNCTAISLWVGWALNCVMKNKFHERQFFPLFFQWAKQNKPVSCCYPYLAEKQKCIWLLIDSLCLLHIVFLFKVREAIKNIQRGVGGRHRVSKKFAFFISTSIPKQQVSYKNGNKFKHPSR